MSNTPRGQPGIGELSDLCTPWCIHVAVTLRIAEQLAAGLSEIEEVAAAAGADPDALQRLLRHLVSKGIFEEPAPSRFALNEAARALLDPGARLGLDLDGFGGRMAHAWSSLLVAVRTGAAAYHTVFGRPFWDDLDAHPELAARFDDLMGPAGHGRADPDVLIAREWGSVRHVVDVGGGAGALLAAVLRDHPTVRGTLVDLPRTVARAGPILEAAGVAERVTIVGQSFFDPLPPGADLYLLKSVLSDWPDPEARAILTRCAEAARRSSGRVSILNGVAPEGANPSPDVLMLVLVGGKQRSLAEFRELARAAGLEVQAYGTTLSGRFIVECHPIA